MEFLNYKSHPINRKQTAKRIRQHICESKYTIKEFTVAMGLTCTNSVYCWLRGDKMPSIEHLLIISIMCNCQIDDLIVPEENVLLDNA